MQQPQQQGCMQQQQQVMAMRRRTEPKLAARGLEGSDQADSGREVVMLSMPAKGLGLMLMLRITVQGL